MKIRRNTSTPTPEEPPKDPRNDVVVIATNRVESATGDDMGYAEWKYDYIPRIGEQLFIELSNVEDELMGAEALVTVTSIIHHTGKYPRITIKAVASYPHEYEQFVNDAGFLKVRVNRNKF